MRRKMYDDAEEANKEIQTVVVNGKRFFSEEVVNELVYALLRSQKLIPLVRIGDVIHSNTEVIDAAGLNPYCINEGRANADDRLSADFIRFALNKVRCC